MTALPNGFDLKLLLFHQHGLCGSLVTTPLLLYVLFAVWEPSLEAIPFILIYVAFETTASLLAETLVSSK